MEDKCLPFVDYVAWSKLKERTWRAWSLRFKGGSVVALWRFSLATFLFGTLLPEGGPPRGNSRLCTGGYARCIRWSDVPLYPFGTVL